MDPSLDPSIPFEALSAVYRTPPEILEHIFIYCYHDNSIYTLATEAPFNLARTCVRWRDIALYIPLLWSSFHVVLSHRSSKPSLPVLEAWLQRSRTHPLSFSVIYHGLREFNDEFPSSTIENVLSPLRALADHLPRWKSVHFDISDLPHDAVFPSDLAFSNASMIENMSVRSFTPHSRHHSQQLIPSSMIWFSSLAGSSSILNTFACYGTGDISFLTVPWNQLTTLHLECISEISSLYILQIARNLIDCHFSITGHHGDWINQPQLQDSILVMSLRSLVITAERELDGFWERLLIPRLEYLDLHMHSSARQWHHGEDLLQFFTRSTCPVERLSLRNVDMRRSLGPCVKLLSASLRELSVVDGGPLVDEAFLHFLTWRTRKEADGDSMDVEGESTEVETVCPLLEQITLRRCIRAPDGPLSEMIQSRCSPSICSDHISDRDGLAAGHCLPLNSIQIELSEPDHAEDVERLNELLRLGRALGMVQGRVCVKKGVRLAQKRAPTVPVPASVPVLPVPWY